MHALRIFSLAGVICAVCTSMALSQEMAWQKSYGIPGRGTCFNSIVVQNDGYLLAGVDARLDAPTRKAYAVRTSRIGDTLWTRRYDFCESQVFTSALAVSAGGFLLAGWEYCFTGTTCPTFLLFRINENGDSIWARKPFGDFSYSEGHSLIEASGGGFITCGFLSDGWTIPDIFVCETNGSGNITWNRRMLRPDLWEEANQVIRTRDGYYMVVGNSQEQMGSSNDCFAMLMNSAGDTLWLRTYGIPDSIETAFAVAEAADSGFVIAGSAFAGMQLTRIGGHGQLLWQRTYGGNGATAYAITNTPDGGFVIGGTILLKVSPLGDSLWSATLPGVAKAVVRDIDGSIMVAGCGAVEPDAYLIKYVFPHPCGDANADGSVDIFDAVYLIAYIFSGGPAPSPLAAGDANSDGSVDISDVVYLIAYIFSGGPAPCVI